MTALTASRPINQRLGHQAVVPLLKVPVKAGAKIFAGGMVAVDASGYGIPASDTAALKVCGIAQQEADNTSGASGDLVIEVQRGPYKLVNSAGAITQANFYSNAMVVDDQTVALTSTNSIKAGRILQVESDGVFVEVGIF